MMRVACTSIGQGPHPTVPPSLSNALLRAFPPLRGGIKGGVFAQSAKGRAGSETLGAAAPGRRPLSRPTPPRPSPEGREKRRACYLVPSSESRAWLGAFPPLRGGTRVGYSRRARRGVQDLRRWGQLHPRGGRCRGLPHPGPPLRGGRRSGQLSCRQASRALSSALSLPSGEGSRVGYSRRARRGVQDLKRCGQLHPRGGRCRGLPHPGPPLRGGRRSGRSILCRQAVAPSAPRFPSPQGRDQGWGIRAEREGACRI